MSLFRAVRTPLSTSSLLCQGLRSVTGFGAGDAADHKVVPVEEARRFAEECLKSVGAKETHASQMAELLVSADSRGHYSHGMNRLEMYVRDIQQGSTRVDAEPELERSTSSTALVNGNQCLGATVGQFSMDLAIQKAKESGVGWVAAHGSNHYGIAGWYALRACDQGLMGLSFTNTSPLQVPTRGRECVLGTNPIALAAPGNNGDSFVLDMATSTTAIGKVELCKRKDSKIPNGWGVAENGQETNDPNQVLGKGGLMPLGGTEVSGGYKGYGLAMMVEVFCGILSGSHYGTGIRKWIGQHDVPANLGQCFIAVDPNCFAPGFADRMQALMSYCRDMEPAEGAENVMVAGDPERHHLKEVERLGGVSYHDNLVSAMAKLSAELSVPAMQPKA
ncbi:uncharacterized oxidoreductase YjmC-like [Sycon ciliatum]|uniref:uncharacterized oxidoreductase YjmC-like n=1 Tax=Sycon ciliatum TaxID=27933 RepID=UPI0020AB53FA|eukprot:scpid72884/ scgid26663/ Malate/L-sulfolactate dehydrogenase; (R)-2-hydroxyacid dehydrogenase